PAFRWPPSSVPRLGLPFPWSRKAALPDGNPPFPWLLPGPGPVLHSRPFPIPLAILPEPLAFLEFPGDRRQVDPEAFPACRPGPRDDVPAPPDGTAVPVGPEAPVSAPCSFQRAGSLASSLPWPRRPGPFGDASSAPA